MQKGSRVKKQPEPDLSHIEPSLRPLAVPIDGLAPNPRQVNTHDERSISAIAGSLRRHGQKKNLVVNRDGEVIAGWGTVLAARSLGWTHIAVTTSDEDEQGLDGFALEDNRTAQLAHFDDSALMVELQRLGSLGVEAVDLGWNEAELATLVAGMGGDFGDGDQNGGPTPKFEPIDPADVADLGKPGALTKCPACGHEWER